MKLLFCKAILLATSHAGPVSCHPEIVIKGTVIEHNGDLEISGWSLTCELGGPYRASHGVRLCDHGAIINILRKPGEVIPACHLITLFSLHCAAPSGSQPE